MKQSRLLILFLLTGSFLVGQSTSTALLGAPAKAKKPPSASKQLRTLARNLSRVKGYRVSVSIEGGISDNEKHKITQQTVRESYTGDVYRRVMHLPAMRAYRTTKRGARYTSGAWKNILADRSGATCDRLFAFPEVLLGRALRFSKTAKWVDRSGAEIEKNKKVAVEEEEKDTDTPRGRTRVVTKKGEESSLPRFILVKASFAEALKHVLEVEASGCLSGG